MIIKIHKRLLTPEDGQAIMELDDIIRPGVKHDLDHWKWEYFENPVGKIFSFVAQDDGKIVGHHGVLPTWMNVGGKKIMGAQACDDETHPAYRKQGIFSSLVRQSGAYAASEGVSLLYGFPNELNHPIYVKFGWSHPGRLPRLVKVISRKSLLMDDLRRLPRLLKLLNPKTLVQKQAGTQRRGTPKIATEITKRLAWLHSTPPEGRELPKPAANTKIKSITTFDSRFDDFWLKVKDVLPITTWRDSTYLNWRYCSCPDKKYTVFTAEEDNTLVGFIVAKCQQEEGENVGYIGDFLSLPEKAGVASPLIYAVLDYFKNQSVDTAMCHVFEHNQFYQFIKAQGFREDGPGVRLIVWSNMPDLPASTLDCKQWYLMGGDIDTF